MAIDDPMATEPLADALDDARMDVRWLAAEGLVKFGHHGEAAVLKRLVGNSDSQGLREVAHLVLREIVKKTDRETLHPVLSALDGVELESKTPIAAQVALDRLRAMGARTWAEGDERIDPAA